MFKLPRGDEGKLFCILSADGDVPVRATVKLDREEREVALTMPWCQVASYIGRWGWITGEVVDARVAARDLRLAGRVVLAQRSAAAADRGGAEPVLGG